MRSERNCVDKDCDKCDSVVMPVIYIRGVKEKQVRLLKVAAAGKGQGLAEYCLAALMKHVKYEAEEEAKPVVEKPFLGAGLPVMSRSEAMRKMRES